MSETELLTLGCAPTLQTTLGYVEMVRSQFLSLRQSNIPRIDRGFARRESDWSLGYPRKVAENAIFLQGLRTVVRSLVPDLLEIKTDSGWAISNPSRVQRVRALVLLLQSAPVRDHQPQSRPDA
jgi:hypothetical protein